jgi:hypothetical protein
MASDKDDSLKSFSVQVNGENYFYWNYVMKNFLKGKKMWSYVDRTLVKPTDKKDEAKYATELETYDTRLIIQFLSQ